MELSIKQLKFIKYVLVDNLNQTEAVIQAFGYSNRRSAAVEGTRLMKRPLIIQTIRETLEEGGISNRHMVRVLKNGLEANLMVKDLNGIIKETNIPDHSVRLKALRLSLKVFGLVN